MERKVNQGQAKGGTGVALGGAAVVRPGGGSARRDSINCLHGIRRAQLIRKGSFRRTPEITRPIRPCMLAAPLGTQ